METQDVWGRNDDDEREFLAFGLSNLRALLAYTEFQLSDRRRPLYKNMGVTSHSESQDHVEPLHRKGVRVRQ